MVIKPFHEYTKEELANVYTELFGFTPCKTCNGVDWYGVYASILKVFNNKNLNNMKNQKYIWNNEYFDYICFANGQPVKVGDEVEQEIMEIIYKNKSLLPLVILNPNFKEDNDVKDENQKTSKNKK